jgi:hypothetical protein
MSATQNQLNLMRNANQIQNLGNPNPPNMANVSETLLQTASPINFNLNTNTRVSQDLSDRSAEFCRSFRDIEGIRKLQEVQKDRSYYAAGCGWIYKPSNGINPEINQGALGTHKGPVKDTLPRGAKWMWELDEAEKEISQKICSNASKCSQLQMLGRFSQVCGFCKTTGAVVPIARNGNQLTARYPNDPALTCESSQLVSAGSGACPKEGFSDYGGSQLPIGTQSKFTPLNEGFNTLDDIDSCKPPLTRDCIVLAARLAGCSDSGTLIKSLQSAPAQGNYETPFVNSKPFQAYQQTANPNLTPQIFKDGSVTIQSALDDFGRLLQNTGSGNEKLKASSRDLCIKAGEFSSYDFCKEVNDSTVINSNTIPCVQRDWKENGGTEAGTEYPTLAKYNGVRWSEYIRRRNEVMKNLNSQTKDLNQKSIQQFIGIDTSGEKKFTTEMARDETTRGAETVWIDTRDNSSGSFPPTILKCDLALAKDGPVYPEFNNKETMSAVHRVPQDNIAFTTAFELRPNDDTVTTFQITTDDGFMMSINQNPFENTSYKSNDWGSWRYQGPTTYESKQYYINGVRKSGTNTVVTKWFHGGGIAAHMFYAKQNGALKRQAQSLADRNDMYVTQEPLAPWLQYEICERPNLSDGNRLGFFEKRWNGPAAYTWGTNRPIPSFDVHAKGVVYNSQEKCMTFTKGSSWHTAARFAYTAFRTLTLCVRPKATLANGARALMFNHTNVGGIDIGVSLTNRNNTYMFSLWNGRQWIEVPAAMNEWNLIVLQYVGDRNGLRNITMNVSTLLRLRDSANRRNFLQQLQMSQGSGGAVLAVDATMNRNHAGYLVLGMVANTMRDVNNNPVRPGVESFTGDVKWIHGFRNYIDTERLLNAEIEQSWISRWPRDMPKTFVQSQATKRLLGYEGQTICVPDRTVVSYEVGNQARLKTISGCFPATNGYFGGDPKVGVRKSVFGFFS